MIDIADINRQLVEQDTGLRGQTRRCRLQVGDPGLRAVAMSSSAGIAALRTSSQRICWRPAGGLIGTTMFSVDELRPRGFTGFRPLLNLDTNAVTEDAACTSC